MGKVISNILLGVLAIALTIFTASRTLDLIGQWLPANQQIYQWLALAAFEGGFLLWSLFFAFSAEGAIQRGMALIMIVFDFIGIAIATVADLVLAGAKDGRLPAINQNMQEAIVVAIGIVIVANVAAFMAAKLTHPEKLRAFAVQDAEDVIHTENLRAIKASAPTMAAQIAPLHQRQWAEQTWNKLLPGTGITYIAEQNDVPQIAAPASFAQTGSLQKPVSYAEVSAPKKGILQKIKETFTAAEENQPHVTEEVAEPTPATIVPSEKPKSNAGRKKTDQEVKEGIEYYRTTGKLPEGWTSKSMAAYIRHRYPNGLDTKHDNLEEK